MLHVIPLDKMVNRRLALAATLFAGCGFCTTGAFAGTVKCADREAFIGPLLGKYHETQRAIGYGENFLVEFWANANTGTWSLFLTLPDGKSCAIASGDGFVIHDPPPKGQGG